MRSTLKSTTLESKFPILSVENNLIINKQASVTAAFKVLLPELYSVTKSEYEAIHLAWEKALKVLPNYTIVHRQDWFTEEKYIPNFEKELSFLSRNFELHFNERPYLNHNCYLFISQVTPEQSKRQSNFTTLCQGQLIPKEITPDNTLRFVETIEQFAQIIRDSGLIQLDRLTTDEIVGDNHKAGIIEKYLSLSQDDTTTLEDIILDDEMRIGDKILCMHTISDAEYLPSKVKTDSKFEKLSTDRSDCILSFASPVGLLLPCTHIYNVYIFITNHTENLKLLERQARNMLSLSRYSRSNQINHTWIEQYLNEAISQGQISVKFHANIITWAENKDKLNITKNLVGAGIAKMGCKPRYNTLDLPVLYWAGLPGNEADFPSEESFFTFPRNALCFFVGETNYKESLSPFGIKLTDRSGKPLHLDISDLPLQKGIITNRNKFILGPSGSGKSFFTNHMVRQYHEQGAHILLVDVGNSYQGLCQLINNRTHGEDGIYITYKENDPISFNPFYIENGTFDVEKRESIKTLILTLWKRENETPSRMEEVALSNVVSAYITQIMNDKSISPSFNSFYEFVRDIYRKELMKKKIREKDFDVDGFLNILEPFYKEGEYGFLLNSPQKLDLQDKRFIVFELDNIKDNKVLFPIVTLIIMETFINKMRKLKGIRKVILIEEAWKALTSANMENYIKYLYKTVRKHFGEAVVVSQEIQDVISSAIVKESIINNSDCKILLDQHKFVNKFDQIQALLGLTDKERNQIFSINMANDPKRLYKEVWIGLGGTYSGVYGTEVSLEEYLTYTTEQSEKIELFTLSEKLGGNLELAIRQLAAQKREKQKN